MPHAEPTARRGRSCAVAALARNPAKPCAVTSPAMSRARADRPPAPPAAGGHGGCLANRCARACSAHHSAGAGPCSLGSPRARRPQTILQPTPAAPHQLPPAPKLHAASRSCANAAERPAPPTALPFSSALAPGQGSRPCEWSSYACAVKPMAAEESRAACLERPVIPAVLHHFDEDLVAFQIDEGFRRVGFAKLSEHSAFPRRRGYVSGTSWYSSAHSRIKRTRSGRMR